MSEHIVDLPNGGAADEYTRLHGAKTLYGYNLHEEIVRCRDCMYSWVDGTLCNFWMRDYNFENPTPSSVEPDGFCKWGKSRERL